MRTPCWTARPAIRPRTATPIGWRTPARCSPACGPTATTTGCPTAARTATAAASPTSATSPWAGAGTAGARGGGPGGGRLPAAAHGPILGGCEGQQSYVPGTLHRSSHGPLLASARLGATTGTELAAVGDEGLEKRDVLVVQVVEIIATPRDLSSPKCHSLLQRAFMGAGLAGAWILGPVYVASTSLALATASPPGPKATMSRATISVITLRPPESSSQARVCRRPST